MKRKNIESALDNCLKFIYMKRDAQIAQSVEQRTENPRVAGSIPALGTIVFIIVS